MKTKESWVGQYAAFNEALKYMYARSTGEEKSIYTPWPKLAICLLLPNLFIISLVFFSIKLKSPYKTHGSKLPCKVLVF